MPKSKPPYPAEFRQQTVELVRAGRTPAGTRGVARQLGLRPINTPVCRPQSNGMAESTKRLDGCRAWR